MNIIVTQWALDSYLQLEYEHQLSLKYYCEVMHPDILSLKRYPQDVKFSNSRFWSTMDLDEVSIQGAYKMKWENIHLCVGIMNSAYLCELYIKGDGKKERRQLEKFRTHLNLIKRNRFGLCGVIK